MKKVYQLITYIFILVLIGQLQLFGQVYVDINASGNGDGTSWSNAFITIIDAVASAPTGSEIWIARGTYIQSERLELINSGLKIYGSFAGSETAIDQRDLTNETIISGDVTGDDDPTDLSLNSNDNLELVIFAMESAGPLILDGLVIEGGRGALVGEFSDEPATGGGLITHGKINLTNCKIRNNSARFGGGMYIKHSIAIPTEMNFENCLITNNTGVKFGGGIYAGFGGTKSQYTNCEFTGNTCEFGAGIYCAGGSVTSFADFANCTFSKNEADAGGGITSAAFCAVTLLGCTLDDNEAGRGGGLSVSGSNASAIVSTSIFSNNRSLSDIPSNGLGAGVAVQNGATVEFTSTTFNGNVAEQAGGAIMSLGDNSKTSFTDCTLANNTATNWGGAFYGQEDGELIISTSVFSSNSARDGGAIYLDNPFVATISGSEFEENLASYGAAIEAEDPGTAVELIECDFQSNVADTSGGALYFFDGASLTARGCLFAKNRSNNFWGGAVYLRSINLATSHKISACTFIDNQALQSAGAIFHENGELEIVNSLFSRNVATSDGIGHTISTNQSDNEPGGLTFINNTVHADGEGLGSITQWSLLGDTSKLHAQNNIFNGQSVHWIVEDGNGLFNSLGGNLSSSSDMDDVLTQTTDLKNIDPLFVSANDDNFELQDASPCINAGVVTTAPTTDILGRPRDAMPDMGALEFGGVVSNRSHEKLSGELIFYGNPMANVLRAEWLSEQNGHMLVQISDSQGRILYQDLRQKVREDLMLEIPVIDWPEGNYFITLKSGSKRFSKTFTKCED